MPITDCKIGDCAEPVDLSGGLETLIEEEIAAGLIPDSFFDDLEQLNEALTTDADQTGDKP